MVESSDGADSKEKQIYACQSIFEVAEDDGVNSEEDIDLSENLSGNFGEEKGRMDSMMWRKGATTPWESPT
jgi:hypothetical protein